MDNLKAEQSAAPTGLSTMCREIRSKKFFHLTTIPMKPSDLIDLSNHCWCRQTEQVIGPDGQRVHPTTCDSSRECYRSYFEPSCRTANFDPIKKPPP